MTTLHIIVLAIVQGITEFLPISSSGHLVLVPSIFGWSDQGMAFDVAVHFGSLLAVLVYFREDVARLIFGASEVLRGRLDTQTSRAAFGIGLATIPAAVAGLLLAGWISANLRSPAVVVATLAGYAVLMWAADHFGRKSRSYSDITIRDAFLIGCAQALALVPGTSRSGATITAGLALGLKRADAARFSFLLAVPVILLAAGYETFTLVRSDLPVDWASMALGAGVAAIVAYVSIEFFMRFVNRVGLLPFALYRLVLAGVLLYAVV
ncbi:MAG: undecaprenyl-diphosphate phosphatase [Pseudomonadota bacterium]